jgi:hypothetical protein
LEPDLFRRLVPFHIQLPSYCCEMIDVTTHLPSHQVDCPIILAEQEHYQRMKAAGLVELASYEDEPGETYEDYPQLEISPELRAQCHCPAPGPWRQFIPGPPQVGDLIFTANDADGIPIEYTCRFKEATEQGMVFVVDQTVKNFPRK